MECMRAPSPPGGNVEAGAGPSQQPPRSGRTCVGCRRAKVRCDRQHPCSRCQRLGTACLQDAPTPTPPLSIALSSPHHSLNAPFNVVAAQQLAQHHQHHGGGGISTAGIDYRNAVGPYAELYATAAATAAAAAPTMQAPPGPGSVSTAAWPAHPAVVASLIAFTSDGGLGSIGSGLGGAAVAAGVNKPALGYQPTLAAEILTAHFCTLWASGRVSTTKALAVLRAFALWNAFYESDCSLGALSISSKILGYDEPEQVLSMDGGSGGQHVSGLGRYFRYQPPTDEEAIFGADQRPEGMSAFCRVALRMDDLRIDCNDGFRAAYMDEAAMHRLLWLAPVRPEYIWAHFLPRASYKGFFHAVAELYFQDPARVAQVVHHTITRDKFGNEMRSIVRLRVSVAENGTFFMTSLLIVPAPPEASARPCLSPSPMQAGPGPPMQMPFAPANPVVAAAPSPPSLGVFSIPHGTSAGAAASRSPAPAASPVPLNSLARWAEQGTATAAAAAALLSPPPLLSRAPSPSPMVAPAPVLAPASTPSLSAPAPAAAEEAALAEAEEPRFPFLNWRRPSASPQQHQQAAVLEGQGPPLLPPQQQSYPLPTAPTEEQGAMPPAPPPLDKVESTPGKAAFLSFVRALKAGEGHAQEAAAGGAAAGGATARAAAAPAPGQVVEEDSAEA